jgi:uncharacterized BrkB/YihY/UPF0761 family membrane protein
MEPHDVPRTPEPAAPATPAETSSRMRTGMATARSRVDRLTARAQAERERHEAVDAVFDMADHDSEVGGGIMAGALAYRLFLWMLPLALVAVAGLGLYSDAASSTPDNAARSVGLAGLVTSSVADAASSSARWYAILIGIPLLVYMTRSVLRTLIVIHRLVWSDERGTVPKPTLGATMELLAAFVGYLALSVVASAAREASFAEGLLVTLLIPVPYAALWLAISRRLPHRDATWRDLVPGAIAFGIGVEALHVVTVYFIVPEMGSKEGTYGSLGIAAALLLGLFLISRLIVATAVVNATIVERRRPDARSASRGR